ncbi:transcription elongation factor GreA [Actinocatenispora thailandica]|uniref:Transcription elongation factor GreA n=1 Tax=Actinocatenispora thailandica TaxID=227318 RepID=A0A7R7HVP7_9ACTN|nr:GreA/GreB family elongation factor [Actinocatenispora thailandica]BCJ34402.1 transcription elongation factor GreA [Actinocatenispora thailandica]
MSEPDPVQRLRDELESVGEQRRRLAETLADDRQPGDTADQAEGIERANELRRLDARIEQLQGLLAGGDTGTGLPFGTRAVLRFADGDTERIEIAPVPASGTTGAAITRDSPLARALTGHAVGDTITWRTPGGDASAELVELRPPAG